jgi:short-subunit dehydrogenase
LKTHPVVVITGASSGIGAAAARLFGANNYRVVLAARRLERLESLENEIKENGGEAFAVRVDVGDQPSIESMVAAVMETYGRIDVLINNAGFGRLDWLENLDPQSGIANQLNVNIAGTIQTTRAVLPHMITARSGHIINMASISGFIATPTYTIYAASKHAVRGFTNALRRETRIWGIHVSAIYPGGVDTEFKNHTGAKPKTGVTTPKALLLSPEDVAQALFKLVKRPRRTVVLPWLMWFSILSDWMFPGIVDWIVHRRFVIPERGSK